MNKYQPYSQYKDAADFCKKNDMNMQEAYTVLLNELKKQEEL